MRKPLNQPDFHYWLTNKLLDNEKRLLNQQGFSLPLVIALALMLLTGGLSLANRANQGLFSAIFQNQSWEAREAAEIGMNRIISELNKERNRWLMVQRDGDPDSGIWQNRENSMAVVELRINPCTYIKDYPTDTSTPKYPDYSKIDPDKGAISPYSKKWYIDANGNVSSSSAGATRAFRLIGVKRQNFTTNFSGTTVQALNIFRDRTSTPSGSGTITLEVEGQTHRNGEVIATSVLEKEFELTPKCCKVSFGGQHGGLDYTINPDDPAKESLCISNEQLGLGLLGGASQTNTGSITLNGKANDIESPTGVAINPIYCIADSSSGCAIKTTGSDTKVAIIDQELPPAKTYSGPLGSIDASKPTKPNNINNFLSEITVSGKSFVVINGGASSLPTGCTASADAVNCNLSQFSYSNTDVLFVTSTRRITLYFPNNDPKAPSDTIIKNNGTGSLLHCLTTSLTYDAATKKYNCVNEPTGAQITNLSLFGCNPSPSCSSQTVTLRGNDGALKLFSYFPVGNVELSGGSFFEGVNWSDTITANGNTTWIVPGSGLASVYEFMNMLPSPNGSGTITNSLISYDFIARATNRYRWK